MGSFFVAGNTPSKDSKGESAGGVAVCCSVSPAFHVPPLWLWLLLAWGSGPALRFPGWVAVGFCASALRAVPPQGNTQKKKKERVH